MDLQLTTKSQEALAGAVRRAATSGQAQVEQALRDSGLLP